MATRSRKGCWTCRLRRRKCDEQQPSCNMCEARDLTCYGYGPRPDWMDRGKKERQAAERLTREMKMATERKRSPFSVIVTMNPMADIPRVTEATDRVPSWSSLQDSNELLTCKISIIQPQAENVAHWNSPSSVTEHHYLPQASEDQIREGLAHSVRQPQNPFDASNAGQEATLLMHYLDNVFQKQLRFYDRCSSNGNRGWLLLLLTQSKPAYHAVLSLSAYHLYSSLASENSSRRTWYAEIGRHHVLALRYLQVCINTSINSAKSLELGSAIEALAGVTQLICFEHYRGGTENWQLHLQAASTLIPILTNHLEDLSSSTKPAQAENQTVIIKFLITLYMRLDSLSCISTGLQPVFRNSYRSLLDSKNGKLEVEPVIGCKNWVISLIIETAILDEWKRSSRQRGDLSMRELARRAGEIEGRLEGEIEQNLALMCQYTQPSALSRRVTSEAESQYVTSKITHIFGCASLIYLHVVVSGWNPEVLEIRESVQRSILALRDLPDMELLGSLAWPFCISGCLARGNEEEFFRSLMSDAGVNELSMGNLWNVLQIMERCWSKREEMIRGQISSEWKDIMGILGSGVLLA